GRARRTRRSRWGKSTRSRTGARASRAPAGFASTRRRRPWLRRCRPSLRRCRPWLRRCRPSLSRPARPWGKSADRGAGGELRERRRRAASPRVAEELLAAHQAHPALARSRALVDDPVGVEANHLVVGQLGVPGRAALHQVVAKASLDVAVVLLL